MKFYFNFSRLFVLSYFTAMLAEFVKFQLVRRLKLFFCET